MIFAFCLRSGSFRKDNKANESPSGGPLEGGSHGLPVKGRSEESVVDDVNLQVITGMNKQGAEINVCCKIVFYLFCWTCLIKDF